MRFGSLLHRALESWWANDQLDPSDRLLLALEALAEGMQMHPLDDVDYVLAVELLRGYHFRWLDQPLRTLGVEQEFELPLRHPDNGQASTQFLMRGKVDALCLDQRDGRRYLVEHKTTATHDIGEGSLYWRRLRMDGQVSVYYSAYPEIAGCIYDVIRVSSHKPLKATPPDQRKYTQGKKCRNCKGKPWPVQRHWQPYNLEPPTCPACKGSGFEERPRLYSTQRELDESMEEFGLRLRALIAATPDDFYSRGIVVRLPQEMREHGFDIWEQARLMHEMAENNISPRNPESCIQYNRQCDFFDVCTGAASIQDDRLFRIRSQHPELSTPRQQEATL